MAKYLAKIIGLSSIKVVNLLMASTLPFYEASSIYRISAGKFKSELENENINIKNQIYYLKKMGFIESFVEGKERYYEITNRGLKKIKIDRILNSSIERPERWDGKWRLIIFDVPEDKKYCRDSFRLKLVEKGFIKIQESVYVYPFECTKEVSALSSIYNISQYVLIMIADIIQGEEEIISHFLDSSILTNNDLISLKKSAAAE